MELQQDIYRSIRPWVMSTDEWESWDPVLKTREIGFEELEGGMVKIKLGDGIHKWRELPYAVDVQTWAYSKTQADRRFVPVGTGTAEFNDERVTLANSAAGAASSLLIRGTSSGLTVGQITVSRPDEEPETISLSDPPTLYAFGDVKDEWDIVSGKITYRTAPENVNLLDWEKAELNNFPGKTGPDLVMQGGKIHTTSNNFTPVNAYTGFPLPALSPGTYYLRWKEQGHSGVSFTAPISNIYVLQEINGSRIKVSTWGYTTFDDTIKDRSESFTVTEDMGPLYLNVGYQDPYTGSWMDIWDILLSKYDTDYVPYGVSIRVSLDSPVFESSPPVRLMAGEGSTVLTFPVSVSGRIKYPLLPTDTYSKTEADARYAPALKGTASGSNLSVTDAVAGTRLFGATVLGKTIETGTGDKGPTNPYALGGSLPTKITVNGTEYPLAETSPMWGLPSDVADEYDVMTGLKTQRIGKITFDGTESGWKTSTLSTGQIQFYIQLPLAKDAVGRVCTTHFPERETPTTGAYNTVFTETSYFGAKQLNVFTDVALNLSNWKSWLAAQAAVGTPFTVYYELASPLLTQVGKEKEIACPGTDLVASVDAGAALRLTYSRDLTLAFAALDR